MPAMRNRSGSGTERERGRERSSELSELLSEAEAAPPVQSVDVVVRQLKQRFGATAVSFLIVDMTGSAVVRLSTIGRIETSERRDRIGLFGTIYERVLRTQHLYREPTGAGTERVIVPVTNRGDAIGLLELILPVGEDASGGPEQLDHLDPAVLHAVNEATRYLAYVVISNQRFTDLYTWGKRSTRLTLSAEIQHHLLPPSLSCETPEFAVAGALEPAAEVSGDNFDYTLDRETLYLSVVDPMGHDVNSALLATLLVAALRGARRAGAGLAEQARQADQALIDHGNGHATGQLFHADLYSGLVRFVNAGHPWPLRMRDGVIDEVPCEVDEPFGLPFPHTYRIQRLMLRPNDRLVVLTDGMLEREAEHVDLRAILRDTRYLHAREVAQALANGVLDAAGGALEDDATVMVLDWHGVRGAGADGEGRPGSRTGASGDEDDGNAGAPGEDAGTPARR